MCEVASWGRVGNNMTFSMHKNINTQFMLLGHLNMTDEKDIMVLLQHIIWNLCSLTDELKFACNENLNFYI